MPISVRDYLRFSSAGGLGGAGGGVTLSQVQTEATNVTNNFKAELADPATEGKGAALVAYKAPATSSVARALVDRFNEQYITPEDFGAVGDNSADDTTAIQAFFAAIVSTKATGLLPNKNYKCSQTIAPNGPFALISNRATISFTAAGTYTGVNNRDGSTSGYKVAFDMKGTIGSSIAGHITLSVNAAFPTTIPTDLAALSITSGIAGSWVVQSMKIIKFSIGLFQSDQSGSNPVMLPFTRTTWGLLEISQCIYPIWMGNAGNGLDDTHMQSLRFSRNLSYARIKATEIMAGSLFLLGANNNDVIPQTGSITVGTATLTTSAETAFVVNDYVAVEGAGISGYTLVAKITGVSGTSITLDRNASATVSTASLWRNPPVGISIENGAVGANHFYVEGKFQKSVNVQRSSFVSPDFKVSGGDFSGEYAAAIFCDHIDGAIDVMVNHTASLLDSVVRLGMVSSGGVKARRSCLVRMGGGFAYDTIKLASPSTLFSGYTDESSSYTEDDLESVIGGTRYNHQTLINGSKIVRGNRFGNTVVNGVNSRSGATTVAASATTSIITEANIAPNSRLIVSAHTTNAAIQCLAMVTVNGSGVLSVQPIVSVGGTIANVSKNIAVTNSTASSESVKWAALYLHNENVSGLF